MITGRICLARKQPRELQSQVWLKLGMLSLSVLFLITACAKPSSKNALVVDDTPNRVNPALNSSESAPKPIKVSTKKITQEEAESSAPIEIDATQTPAPGQAENLSGEFSVKFDDSSWKLIGDTDGVQTFKNKQEDAGVVSFRGETLVPASLLKIATILNADNLRKQWVEGLLETRVIEQVNPLERVEYNHTKSPWPFEDRDFLYHLNVYSKREPLALLITMKSVEDPRMPKQNGLVRAQILHSYYYMKEVPGVRATKVVIEMAVDPKGAIPLWVMNMVQQNWPYKTLQALRKIAQREDITVSEDVKNYLYNGVPAKSGVTSSLVQDGRSVKSKKKEGVLK